MTREYNFDGLIGPTHNFSGLAFGNLASDKSRYKVSNPRAAALQGLAKMKLLHSLGVKQGFIPPHPRPSFQALRHFGYTGSDRQILEKVYRQDPKLLLTCSSASGMWTANAATISPSCDTKNNRVHITPANLTTQSHRSIESTETAAILKIIFCDKDIFVHHPALACGGSLFDEGAANHMRLCESHTRKGIEIFVYGKDQGSPPQESPQVYPARQSLKASRTNAAHHRLSPDTVILAKQDPEIIDLGVFHNDVIAVSNENVLIFHERAFREKRRIIEEIQSKFSKLSTQNLFLLEVTEAQLTVQTAVESYFFNSQIVTIADGTMTWIAPEECQERAKVKALIDEIIGRDNPIKGVHFIDLKESMRNGGGPACLRLRVVLNEDEERGVHQGFILNGKGFAQLEGWVRKHYRDRLHMDDLKDFHLVKESYTALDALTQIFDLGCIYDFQRE